MASFRKLPSGLWQVQIRRKSLPTISKTFQSKLIAQKWARVIETEVDSGVFVDKSELEKIKAELNA
jgi:hypothetical protein